MFLSSNKELVYFLKMAVTSVIFFINLSSCSVYGAIPQALSNSALKGDGYTENNYNAKDLDGNQKRIDKIFNLAIQNDTSIIVYKKEESSFDNLMFANELPAYKTVGHYNNISGNEFYNLVKVPENDPEWLSILISFVALVSSVAIPIYLHTKQRREAINEGYWIREVIMPKINSLAFEVSTEFKNSMSLPLVDFVTRFDDYLLPKLGELRDSLYLFESFPSIINDIGILEGVCDDFEQKVDNNQNGVLKDRINDVSWFHTTFIKTLIDIHKKIN